MGRTTVGKGPASRPTKWSSSRKGRSRPEAKETAGSLPETLARTAVLLLTTRRSHSLTTSLVRRWNVPRVDLTDQAGKQKSNSTGKHSAPQDSTGEITIRVTGAAVVAITTADTVTTAKAADTARTKVVTTAAKEVVDITITEVVIQTGEVAAEAVAMEEGEAEDGGDREEDVAARDGVMCAVTSNCATPSLSVKSQQT